ncbi:GAF domain-containing protein [Cerasicoccus maritimus]|uniref:GAF domain-containing protein n=1 Tax=Cerasicoccus maritimus TaxID=490089 RepID=UPI0028526592|nr:GAF domain-containing protein [Cerasicoccus maritimus]
MLVTSSASFIKVTEIWAPSSSGEHMELQSGSYGELDAFREASKSESFAYDEGLPGKVWSTRAPVILKEFTNQNFKRTAIAHESGLSCGIAFPVFIGEFLKAVVVFLCGEEGEHLGAIESWKRESHSGHDIGLADGYFGTMDDFGFITQQTRYTKGFGLPGLVWEKNMPVIIDDLGHSGSFSRTFDLSSAEITSAVGIPCHGDSGKTSIVCLLSSAKMPIARRYEIWIPTIDRSGLELFSATCSQTPGHRKAMCSHKIEKATGALGLTWRTGLPYIGTLSSDSTSIPEKSAFEAGLTQVVTVPTTENGLLKAIIAWYL